VTTSNPSRNEAPRWQAFAGGVDHFLSGQKKTASEDAVFKLKRAVATLVSDGDLSNRVYIHAAAFAVKAHEAVHQSENRVITAESHVLAWSELRTALADDYVARNHCFAAELFDTKTFAVAIAAVLD
jgi:hypothetical protein